MNLHTRGSGRSRELVVFVHGLNGSGNKTWQDFPAFIFNDYSLDVAIFDYPTLIRRILGRVKLDFCIQLLRDCIRELEAVYDSIFLVGHSLGGIIVEAAAREYIQDRAMGNYSEITPLAGIVLIASPRAGSGWAVPFLRRVVAEGSWLRRGSPQTQRLTDFFFSYIQTHNTAFIEPKSVLLPCYSCIVGGDWFVNAYSAGFSIPPRQKIRLIPPLQTKLPFGRHASIVKPIRADDEQVRWVRRIVMEINEVRRQWQRERDHAKASTAGASPLASIIVTEFWAGPNGLPWLELYNEVRRSAGTPDLEVHDYRDVPNAPVDLLMAVSDADAVLVHMSSERTRIMQARARREANEKLTVGLSAVGERCGDAKRRVEEWLHTIGWLPSVYVEGVPDNNALRSLIASWLHAVIGRDPRRGKSNSSRIERVIRTDLDPYDSTANGGFL